MRGMDCKPRLKTATVLVEGEYFFVSCVMNGWQKRKKQESSFFGLGEPTHGSRQILCGILSTCKIMERHEIDAR